MKTYLANEAGSGKKYIPEIPPRMRGIMDRILARNLYKVWELLMMHSAWQLNATAAYTGRINPPLDKLLNVSVVHEKDSIQFSVVGSLRTWANFIKFMKTFKLPSQ